MIYMLTKKYKQCGIYCYHNIVNGKNYVGQSVNLKRRKSGFGSKRYSGIYFQRAIEKYGKKSFQYSILTHCKPDELNYFEQFYISRLRTNDPKYGYNCTSGGDSRYELSDITKKRISESWTEDRRKKQSELQTGENNGNYGRKWNNEEKEKASRRKKKLSNHRFLKKHGIGIEKMSELVREYIQEKPFASYTEIRSHFNLTELQTRRICHKIGYTTDKALSSFFDKIKKKVAQCDRENHNIIFNVFSSLTEAEHLTGIHGIRHCVEGNQYSSGGYYWKYSDDAVFTGEYNSEFLKPTKDRRKLDKNVKQKFLASGFYKRENLYKKVFCYNKHGELVKVYDSVSSVKKDGFSEHMASCCANPNNIQRTHKNHVFSYTELTKEDVLNIFVKHVKKPVIQMTMNGEYIREWESATEAAKTLGLSTMANINSCCHGKAKSAAGYKWIFKDN